MSTSQCLDSILRPLWNGSSTPNRHGPRACITLMGTTGLRSEATTGTHWRDPQTRQNWNSLCTILCGISTLLCTGCWCNNAPGYQWNQRFPSLAHAKNDECLQNVTWLCCNLVPFGHYPLPCKWHGSQYRHRCSLSCPTQCAQSRHDCAGNYILSNTPPPPPEIPNPKPNGMILTICKTIHNVMTSAPVVWIFRKFRMHLAMLLSS